MNGPQSPRGTTPLTRYQHEIDSGQLLPDAAQAAAVKELERVFHEVQKGPVSKAPSGGGLLSGFARRFAKEPVKSLPARGAYLWGGVGRGKTHLVNSFFELVPVEEKLRVHFHRFMLRVHRELRGVRDLERPLQHVAETIAREARVLCFDEFHVSDIADAMLLAGLFEALFEKGVTLVATSNVAPDDLYRDGLQRARFLPAIALIKQHTNSVHVDGTEDYRLRALERAETYHTPLDEDADRSLSETFHSLCDGPFESGAALEILGRSIPTVRSAEGIAWFDFVDLCDGPRGAADYIELARCFHTVLIANVPVMAANENDRVVRFISLVDEFYDRNVNLILSAAEPPARLYPDGRKTFEFQRTTSRLQEMQSREYLAKKHIP